MLPIAPILPSPDLVPFHPERHPMHTTPAPGQIIILNGTPRAGKSSIAAAIQDTFAGLWLNLGVDRWMQMTPARYQPALGLRPGGERPDLEPVVATLYRALYASIAAHSRLGINVVADTGHHDDYSTPLGILPACARLLDGLPALLVGVRCPLDVILQRRRATGWDADRAPTDPVSPPILRWQTAVHIPGLYDLEVDTSLLTPTECAAAIRRRLMEVPTQGALAQVAQPGA
jgi:chloramphenicol 3-O phosphotransferase